MHLIGTVFSSYNGLVQSGRLELISLFYKYLLTFSVLFFSVWLKKPHTYIPRYVFFFFDAFNHIGNKIKKSTKKLKNEKKWWFADINANYIFFRFVCFQFWIRHGFKRNLQHLQVWQQVPQNGKEPHFTVIWFHLVADNLLLDFVQGVKR